MCRTVTSWQREEKMPERGEQETDKLNSGKEGKSWELNTALVFSTFCVPETSSTSTLKHRKGKNNKRVMRDLLKSCDFSRHALKYVGIKEGPPEQRLITMMT